MTRRTAIFAKENDLRRLLAFVLSREEPSVQARIDISSLKTKDEIIDRLTWLGVISSS